MMEMSARFWDKRAEKYARRPIADVPAYDRTMERVAAHLGPQDHVLELGCGTGTTALRLAEFAGRITATDIAPKMLEIGRDKAKDQKVSNVTFVEGSADTGDLPQGPYDVVMAFNLLHLMRNPQGVICKAHALLKPGGVFISKTPCVAGHYRILRLIMPVLRALRIAPYFRFLSVEEVDGFVRANDVEIVETGNYPASPPSRFIVARKL